MEFWTKVLLTLRQGKRAILLIVVDHKGSCPGKQGFKMLVSEDDKQYGTIGGGVSEHTLVERAKKLLEDQAEQAEMHHEAHSGEDDKHSSGMICSGENKVLLYPLGKEHIDNINEIITALTLKHELTVEFSKEFFHLRMTAAIEGHYEFDENEIFREVVGYTHHVLIFGGGHVGLALSEQLKMLDFYVSVFDNRAELDTMENNSFADEKHVIKYSEIDSYIPKKKDVYAVISSFTHANDKLILKSLLNHPLKYIGMMGSENKKEEIFKQLEEDGVSKEKLDTVSCPIGVNINSNTAQEIAVSIAAELIHLRNKQ